jgi:hypothetical protein
VRTEASADIARPWYSFAQNSADGCGRLPPYARLIETSTLAAKSIYRVFSAWRPCLIDGKVHRVVPFAVDCEVYWLPPVALDGEVDDIVCIKTSGW